MNDFYQSYWAIPGEKNHVICQEIGQFWAWGIPAKMEQAKEPVWIILRILTASGLMLMI